MDLVPFSPVVTSAEEWTQGSLWRGTDIAKSTRGRHVSNFQLYVWASSHLFSFLKIFSLSLINFALCHLKWEAPWIMHYLSCGVEESASWLLLTFHVTAWGELCLGAHRQVCLLRDIIIPIRLHFSACSIWMEIHRATETTQFSLLDKSCEIDYAQVSFRSELA